MCPWRHPSYNLLCCPAVGMSLFCTGWTFIWLLLLPFGIIPDSTPNSSEATWWAMLPISVMTAMMLGLEDLATQLEDPFKFIPYGEVADCSAGCGPDGAGVQHSESLLSGGRDGSAAGINLTAEVAQFKGSGCGDTRHVIQTHLAQPLAGPARLHHQSPWVEVRLRTVLAVPGTVSCLCAMWRLQGNMPTRDTLLTPCLVLCRGHGCNHCQGHAPHSCRRTSLQEDDPAHAHSHAGCSCSRTAYTAYLA